MENVCRRILLSRKTQAYLKHSEAVVQSVRKGIFKGALSHLRQVLVTEIPLKIKKNVFYYTLKKFFSFSRYLNFCLDFVIILKNGLMTKVRVISI